MLTLIARNRRHAGHWLLLGMLGLLHGAMLLGIGSVWTRPLLLAHLGLFLLWQPLWRGEREVGRSGFAFILLAATVAVFWLNWWIVAFWMTGLFGIVGARVFAFHDRWTRFSYLSVMAYLLAVLLLWVVPHLFGVSAGAGEGHFETGHLLMWHLLPVLLLLLAAMPVRDEAAESAQTVDFIYSLLLFMLLALVVLGSLAFMFLAKLDYLEALLRTLLLTGLLLLVLGGLWNPRFGFGGLQVMFSRYLLNVGTPFETWLSRLADAAQREPDAAAYLRRATVLLVGFPWLSGLSWQSPDGEGRLGNPGAQEVEIEEGGLRLTLYPAQPLNPAILLHVHLLVQLVGYFYQAKRREQSLRDITRLQAVYETGARLMHDLKNMLQSLLSLTAIAQHVEEKRSRELLQQQLPLLARRIEQTLIKLQQPQGAGEAPQLALAAWWDALKLRNRHQKIAWIAPGTLPEQKIPAALFDCVLDNLLDNALRKRQGEPGLGISVAMHAGPLRLTVCDSGDPIPEAVTANLLRSLIVSEDGLGVGLYQAARWAEQLGYRLVLTDNRPGNVCFELREAGSPA